MSDVLIWSVEQSGTDEFMATYEVDQQMKENAQTKTAKSTYTVLVHVDTNGKLVIVQNPTLAKALEKSNYEPATQEADGTELAYYVQRNALDMINGDYLYSELINPVCTQDGENVIIKMSVKYIDNKTKAM